MTALGPAGWLLIGAGVALCIVVWLRHLLAQEQRYTPRVDWENDR